MSRTLRRLIPSPAMIVALVALVVALGSSAYAQRFVPLITGEDIVDNSVTSADIRNTSLTRKDIRKRSLRGRKFELNSVGGRAIKESRLKTVPSARSAAGLDMWAVVREDGTALRGRGGPVAGNPPGAVRTSAVTPLSSVRDPCCPGNYTLTFGQNIQKCSLQATIVNTSTNGQHGPSGEIIVARLGSNQAKVRTGTGVPNANDKESDRPFNIAAIC